VIIINDRSSDGAAKFSNHDVMCPLPNSEAASGQCHTEVEYVTNRVATIQNQVNETMSAAEGAIISAIRAIETSGALIGTDILLLEHARQLHREAQLCWDFIAADNNMGFHNP
jgi:nitrite reductase (cytochrome c-552)